MSRTCLCLLVVLLAGCVPVTNPVGDIEKAEPDRDLLGTWVSTKNPSDIIRFEIRDVKGVPGGMMPLTVLGTNPEREPHWFFTARVGKEKFGNICMDFGGKKEMVLPNFARGDAYRRWKQSPSRFFVVFRYTTGQDGITINLGDEKAFEAIAGEEKLKAQNDGLFETPAGWLARYIEKHGSDRLFPAGKETTFKRKK